ncbi:MAG: bi-domain-containing oxidoreductase [bacterium]
MRQVFVQKGNVYLQEVDQPLLEQRQILVKNHYSFIITGTEIATLCASNKSLLKKISENLSENTTKFLGALKEHGFSGTFALVKSKEQQSFPLGYSSAGQVINIGKNVKNFKKGDFVACAGAGIAYHADMVTVPENLAIKIKDPAFLKQASLTTIGAIALQGIRRAELQLGENVCVIGLGLIGQLTVQLAKQVGCTVFGVDIQQDRLTLAQQFGADYVFNPTTIDIIKETAFATSHYGVDTTIITAASQSGSIIQQAMHITRRKGKVVLVGDVKLDFDRNPFYSKEIDLLISCSYGPGRYDQAYEHDGHDYPYPYVRWTENRNMELFAKLVQKKQINIDPLISHEFTIDHVVQAYECLKQKKALGIVLSYIDQEQPQTTQEQDVPLKEKYRKKSPFSFPETYKKNEFSYTKDKAIYTPPIGTLRVAIVGAGGFCKTKLLPIISKIKQTRIHSIVDANAANATNVARLYQARRISNDHLKIVNDDDINAVVIATPHHLHAQQALDCLQKGKAVFVEKPAAVSWEQLEDLRKHFQAYPGSFYCVDFNRSFAPFISAIKDAIRLRTNPLIINYRINAGMIPQDHWIQSVENRGRIIGEACHIFELFCFLTDSKPKSLSVNVLHPVGQDLALTDNVITQLQMEDGSCCTLTYTSLGHKKLNKEYMEIFFDGKTIIMNDFVELTGYGLPFSFNKKVRMANKGHEILLKEFFTAATQLKPLPLSFERIAIATQISLIVDQIARSGGGYKNISI